MRISRQSGFASCEAMATGFSSKAAEPTSDNWTSKKRKTPAYMFQIPANWCSKTPAFETGAWSTAMAVSASWFSKAPRQRLPGVHFSNNNAVQVFVTQPGSRLNLTDSVAVDAQPIANGNFGRGLEVSNGATANVRRLRVDGAADRGVYVLLGGQLQAEDIAVFRTRDTGIDIGRVGRATLTRARLQEVMEGIEVTETGSALDAQDVHLTGSSSFGIVSTEGTNLSLVRAQIEDVRGFAVAAVGPQSSVSIEDVTATNLAPAGEFSNAIILSSVNRASLRRASLRNLRGRGLTVEISEATISDVTIQDADPPPTIPQLPAAAYIFSSNVEMARMKVVNAVGDGIRSLQMSGALRDIDIQAVRSSTACVAPGNGFSGTRFEGTIQRIRIADVDTVGLATFGSSDIDMADVLIEDTQLGPCSRSGGTAAVLAGDNSVVQIRQFILRNNLRTGAAAQADARLVLEDGIIENHRFGLATANETVAGTDVLLKVTYRDNTTAMIVGQDAEPFVEP